MSELSENWRKRIRPWSGNYVNQAIEQCADELEARDAEICVEVALLLSRCKGTDCRAAFDSFDTERQLESILKKLGGQP